MTFLQRAIRTNAMRTIFTGKSIVPRNLAVLNDTKRNFAIDSQLKKKEKVEEDRYIRQKEADRMEALKRKEADMANAVEVQAKMKAIQKEVHEVNETMEAVSNILMKSGDKISDQGLRNLAFWKKE